MWHLFITLVKVGHNLWIDYKDSGSNIQTLIAPKPHVSKTSQQIKLNPSFENYTEYNQSSQGATSAYNTTRNWGWSEPLAGRISQRQGKRSSESVWWKWLYRQKPWRTRTWRRWCWRQLVEAPQLRRSCPKTRSVSDLGWP